MRVYSFHLFGANLTHIFVVRHTTVESWNTLRVHSSLFQAMRLHIVVRCWTPSSSISSISLSFSFCTCKQQHTRNATVANDWWNVEHVERDCWRTDETRRDREGRVESFDRRRRRCCCFSCHCPTKLIVNFQASYIPPSAKHTHNTRCVHFMSTETAMSKLRRQTKTFSSKRRHNGREAAVAATASSDDGAWSNRMKERSREFERRSRSRTELESDTKTR